MPITQCIGGHDSSQAPWHDAADKIKPNGSVADSSGYQAISRFVAGTMVSKSATWVSAGVLKNGSPQSWAVPGTQSFQKGIFVHGEVQNYCCSENILFSQFADISGLS